MIHIRINDLYGSIEEILFDYLPRVYDELNKEEDYPYLQYFDVIHEILTRAYYLSQYEKVMLNLKHGGWMNLILQYYDGNPGALSFLMDLSIWGVMHSVVLVKCVYLRQRSISPKISGTITS